MKESIFEAIVIGGGPAGLNTSYWLKQAGVDHLVFERGKIGESWRSQRWDRFMLNSSNRLNMPAGGKYATDDPEGFCSSREYVNSLIEYVSMYQLPVVENAFVESVERDAGSMLFKTKVDQNGARQIYRSRQVVVASGAQNEIRMPEFAAEIPADIVQMHSMDYRNAGQLPDGNILVVGSAQTGCQVAEDLMDAGKKVYLSTSMVVRAPRRYRDRDIMDWFIEMKFFDAKKEDIADPKMLEMRAGQLTGVDGGRRTISLQSLAGKGAIIIGKMDGVEGNRLVFQPNAATHVKFADAFSQKAKDIIDEYINRNNLPYPPNDPDPNDMPDENASCVSLLDSLDVREHQISVIIWATGFNADLSYLKVPVVDADGNLLHKDGISDVEGLYFVGFPWLRSRKSVLLCGIKDDAEFIAKQVYNFSQTELSASA